MRTWTCGACERRYPNLYSVGRRWLCIWCIDIDALPTIRQRARIARARAQATVAHALECRERRNVER